MTRLRALIDKPGLVRVNGLSLDFFVPKRSPISAFKDRHRRIWIPHQSFACRGLLLSSSMLCLYQAYASIAFIQKEQNLVLQVHYEVS